MTGIGKRMINAPSSQRRPGTKWCETHCPALANLPGSSYARELSLLPGLERCDPPRTAPFLWKPSGGVLEL